MIRVISCRRLLVPYLRPRQIRKIPKFTSSTRVYTLLHESLSVTGGACVHKTCDACPGTAVYTQPPSIFTKFSIVCTFIRGSGLLPTYPDASAVRYPDTVLSLAVLGHTAPLYTFIQCTAVVLY
jgi:hypothetical protein